MQQVNNFWEVKPGLIFIAKGVGRQMYRVASFCGVGDDIATLERIGKPKGTINVKRADVPKYIDKILGGA